MFINILCFKISTAMEDYEEDEINNKVTSRSTISCCSLAPTDFHLSQSFENSSTVGTVSVALERCLLCAGSRRSFYCKNCIRDGHFVHSQSLRNPFQQLNRHSRSESYAIKSERWNTLKQERVKLLERFHASMKKKLAISNQRTEIFMCQQRIQTIKDALSNLEQNLSNNNQNLQKLLHKTSTAERKADYHVSERVKFNSYLAKLSLSIERQAKKYKECSAELAMRRRQGVSDLVTYILPITEIQSKSESPSLIAEDVQQSTVSLLADARRTAYIKGRWIITDSGYEQRYRIVLPTLPGSGNYSLALVDSKDIESPTAAASTGSECQTDGNLSHTIRAALSLTSQLVSLVAVYLDVLLPHHINYSEFCHGELTERRFNRLVYGLNLNVLCLCFTQRGVNISSLDSQNTLGNLLALLSSREIGTALTCSSNDEATAQLMHSLEHILHDGLQSAIEAADDNYLDSLEDEDQLLMTRDNQEEWEQVSTMLPEAEMLSMSPTSHNTLPSYFSESHSNVTSLVTSAASSVASSVASFWRGWGRTPDK